MEKQKIELNLPANLKFSSLVRHLTDEVFMSAGFTKEWSSRLKLVVDELFMNAVKYGSTEDKSTVHIEISYDNKEVGFKIEDDGTGSEKMSAEELKNKIQKNADNTEVTATSGRGLALISHLWTDDLKIENSSQGGIAISFVKKIETTPPPSASLPEVLIPEVKPVEQKNEIAKEQKKLQTGPIVTVKLKGEIDQSNLDDLTLPVNQQLNTLPEGAKLTLDFKDVSYINSTVIGQLAAWHNEVRKKNAVMVLANTNNQIKDILNLVGLDNVLNIE